MRAVLGPPGNFVDSSRYVRMMVLISRRNAIPILAGALLLAGCSEDKPTKAEEVAAASVPGAPREAAADETAKNAPASNFSENNDLIEFTDASPAAAARLPDMATRHDKEQPKQRRVG